MDDIKFKEQVMKNAIKIINKGNTFLRNWFNYFKYILSLIGIRNILCQQIGFYKIKISYNGIKYLCTPPVKILIMDDCLLMNNYFIPYEYIINLKRYNLEKFTLYTLDILGTLIISENALKIKLGGGHVKILLFTNSKYNLIKTIKNNMYYHIKYNKINEEVIFDLNKKNN